MSIYISLLLEDYFSLRKTRTRETWWSVKSFLRRAFGEGQTTRSEEFRHIAETDSKFVDEANKVVSDFILKHAGTKDLLKDAIFRIELHVKRLEFRLSYLVVYGGFLVAYVLLEKVGILPKGTSAIVAIVTIMVTMERVVNQIRKNSAEELLLFLEKELSEFEENET